MQLLRRMQQLLRDKGGAPDRDGTFLHELFLQRLPANIRMVLGLTDESLALSKLVELTDKLMEVATPSVSAIATPQITTEVKQLRTEVTQLQELVKSLTTLACQRSTSNPRHSPSLARPRPHQLQILHFAGTTRNSVKLLTSVSNLAPEG